MSDVHFAELADRRGLFEEFKSQVKLYLLYRRYQKMQVGELPWEEKLIAVISKSALEKFFKALLAHLIASWRQIVKRSLDITVSLIGVILSLPLTALIAIAIKLDSNGPVFFGQTRVGMKGKIFNMFKFRTMCQDAEAKTGPVWAKASDPRVTRIGSLLRKTHLDELPQLFNVLLGEMSLVGPRPERPYFVREFRKIIPHYERRLYAKPGITGLAQIKRRYDETLEDVKRKVKYDVLYIRKMCPLLDMKVLALTIGAVLSRTGR